MRNVSRRKAIVVPFVMEGGKPYFLMFRDSTYNELTFPSGGCKNDESSLHCAMRELYEESRTILKMEDFESKMPIFSFYTDYRSETELKADKKNKLKVIVKFDVFIGRLKHDRKHYIHAYDEALKSTDHMAKDFKETKGIEFVPFKVLYSIVTSKRPVKTDIVVWDFMKSVALPKIFCYMNPYEEYVMSESEKNLMRTFIKHQMKVSHM